MTTLPTSKIEALAGDVLTETFGPLANLDPPINLGAIADHHKLAILYGNFDEDNISGAYSKAKREIYVSPQQGFPHQSFTIAHELGHYSLHQNVKEDTMLRQDTLDPEAQNTPQEAEANKFAVSQTAANWRLRNLGLIND